MLSKEDFMKIKALSERGVYQKDIAEQLGVHPKTVSRALKRGNAPVREAKQRESKLEPYKPLVDRLLREEVWNAVVILREVQAAGYAGGYTILRQYIAPKRVLRAGRQTVRFETEADFAKWDAALYSDQLLPQSRWQEMWEPIKLNDGTLSDRGLGWMVIDFEERRLVNHGGLLPGFASYIARFVDDEITVVVFTNSSLDWSANIPAALAKDIGKLYFE